MRSHDSRLAVALLWITALLAGAVTATAYWPGLMTWDSVHQYDEALSGDFTDWHPPAMQWLWRRLLAIHSGPAPMLLLQLGLYWGGLASLASAMCIRRRRRLAWALLACGLFPLGLALTGAVLKDCLMASALLAATGLLALGRGRRCVVLRVAAGALLVFAATLRFNGFAASLPLLVALLPPSWRRTAPRLFIATLAATAALLSAMPLADHAIGARPSGVALSLVIFDLGGITARSGTSVFPREPGVRDPVVANRRCYDPNKWDGYSDWVDPQCPLGFTAWNRIAPSHPYAVWFRAVLSHPIAYAEHRLAHVAINTRLVPLADTIERPVQAEDAPNSWGFGVKRGVLLSAIDTMALAIAHTPAGWPIVWIALAFGALLAGRGTPDAGLIVPLALSSLLYGGSYLPLSVASELRYHLWTMLAALLATVLIIANFPSVAGRRLVVVYAPAAIVTLAALTLRS